MRHAAIIQALEQFARPSYQEKWDNTGLQVGSLHDECTGVLVCLDPTPAIVEEAISLNCNLIISHHPLFFSPIKRLIGATVPEATAINAITAGITIYSSHTAADSAPGGVSYTMAKMLGVEPIRVLAPLEGYLVSLSVIVPNAKAQEVQAALFDAGAGQIGKYDCCSFNVEGTGTFRALDGAKPYVGEIGLSHTEAETEISVVLPAYLKAQVEKAMLEVHPYETPAYKFTPMLNTLSDTGLGIYGTIDSELSPEQFVEHVKKTFGCKAVRTTKLAPDHDAKIRRVAMCGGAGHEFISTAIAMGAQAFISADLKYHDFVEFRDQILVIDAGHFETEAPIKQVFASVIKEKFPTVPVHCTSTEDNPINYQ